MDQVRFHVVADIKEGSEAKHVFCSRNQSRYSMEMIGIIRGVSLEK